MNSVTGARLAATLARRGGLGVLPQDMPLQDLDAAIRWVKAQPPRWDTPLVLPPDATVADALAAASAGRGPRHRRCTDARGSTSRRTASPRDAARHRAARRPPRRPRARRARLASTPTTSTAPRHAFDLIVGRRRSRPRRVLAPRPRRRHALAPERPALARSTAGVDASGRLSVAAAVGINGDVAAKARALAAAGVDVLVIDTAHGHQEGMLAALAHRRATWTSASRSPRATSSPPRACTTS